MNNKGRLLGFMKKIGGKSIPKGQQSGMSTGAGKSMCLRGKMMGSREGEGERRHDSLREPTEMGPTGHREYILRNRGR